MPLTFNKNEWSDLNYAVTERAFGKWLAFALEADIYEHMM